MDNPKTIKFDMNTDYNLILSFDEPKVFQNEQYGGNSTMYGAILSGEEVRFYASKGLHEEIQKQGLGKGAKCHVKKVKPGDFPYFIVNGQSKHELMTIDEFKANEIEEKSEATFQNAPSHNDSDLVEKVNVLWKWMETCKVDKDGEKIPF